VVSLCTILLPSPYFFSRGQGKGDSSSGFGLVVFSFFFFSPLRFFLLHFSVRDLLLLLAFWFESVLGFAKFSSPFPFSSSSKANSLHFLNSNLAWKFSEVEL
jgi:hypothetical protein